MPEPITTATTAQATALTRQIAQQTPQISENPAATATTVDGVGQSFRDALQSVGRSERVVDRAVRRAARGADLSPGELLAVQTAVYRASRQAELVAKAVDRVSDSVKEVTQIRI